MNNRRRIAFAFTLALWIGSPAAAQDKKEAPKAKDTNPLLVNEPRACQGYTLIPPLQSKTTFLVDMQGRVVHTWESAYTAGLSAYLLENGNLLRPGKIKSEELLFEGAGAGGRVQEFTWDGALIWDFKLHNDKQLPHHDICKMPNGNILMLVWEKKTVPESMAAGCKTSAVRATWLCDSIVEIKPNGKTGGEVVWQWHVWDHLIQDHDKSKANFGDVAAHPELIDVNFGHDQGFAGLFTAPKKDDKKDPKKDESKKDDPKVADAKNDDLEKLKSIGYVGSGKGKAPFHPDWPHLNCVTYNAELDQIMISSRLMSEFWIIDHSTTSAEAASHKGGKYGKGGDLLYRWGNPQAYRAGTVKNQMLFTQHNAHWIPKGHPGAGHVIVYNNARGNLLAGNYSSVDEIELPVNGDGKYTQAPGAAFGPEKVVWSYTAPKKTDFYSWVISGAHRLPNGNTLVCEGLSGTIFEVTPEKDLVWKYKSQWTAGKPFTGPSKPGQVLSPPLQDALKLSAEQKSRLGDLQKTVDDRLEKSLAEEQRKSLKEIQESRSVVGGFAPHGKIMTPFLLSRLKLSDEQKKQFAQLQNEIDVQLDKTFNDEQKKSFKSAKAAHPSGGGFFNFDEMFARAVFRSYRYPADYPGLAGRDLTPKKGKDDQ